MASLIYEGQLMKKGKVNRAWKNRWCKLISVNGEIYVEYYDSKMNSNLCGTIELSQIYSIEVVHFADYDLSMLQQIPNQCVITDKIKCQQKYSFLLITPNRKYIFASFDPHNFFQWLTVFNEFVNGGIIKQGWLQKRGEKNKGWKKRFFVLNQYKQIKYYQNEQKLKNFCGNICLNEITAVKKGEIVQAKEKKYTFQLNTDKRIWILSANSLNERRSWTELIEKWIKMRVEIDYQKQILFPHDDAKQDTSTNDNVYFDQIYSSCDDADGILSPTIKGFRCTFCKKEFATQWPKCPSCFRRGTHNIRQKKEKVFEFSSPP